MGKPAWTSSQRLMRTQSKWPTLVIVALSAMLIIAVAIGRKAASQPARCPQGMVDTPTRCCSLGQSEADSRCVGTAEACPVGLDAKDGSCVVPPQRVLIPAGIARVGPSDWEAHGRAPMRDAVIDAPFYIDAFEVTFDRWFACMQAGACAAPDHEGEAGQPVRGVTLYQAIEFCRWAGGELPSDDMWVLAAAGPSARRYPWGDTGAVCRRADWGKRDGPCANGGTGPDWVGIAGMDRTPEGVVGLGGGVSEWVRTSDRGGTRGGSYRSRLATHLRTWWGEQRDPDRAYEDVGLRCAYQRSSD